MLRTAQGALTTYAQTVSGNADSLADEINSVILKVNGPAVPACSEQDLAELKAQTFRAAHIKDIGRTHDGKLYCSAFLGRLARPYAEGKPSLVLEEGANVYTHVDVIMDAKGGNSGTVVEAGDVNVVLNSGAFGNWDRPHFRYMVVAINRETKQALELAGTTLEVEPAWVLRNASQTLDGSIYIKVCSTRHAVCVVTAERVADVQKSAVPTQIAYSAMGGFAGLSFGLAIALIYSRARSLSSQLVYAVRTGSSSLQLVYQPIMDVGTGRCMGAEALLRWEDEDGAPIPADAFIPMAEEKGFINELTAFVVHRATRELADLLRDREDFTLSINVSASDMAGDFLSELLEKHAGLAGIRSGQIALELTERCTADLELVGSAIQRLRAEGYQIHIDDFGVGFSSLSYIDQLHVNAIKVDRAFTRTIGTGALIAPILSQIVEMASSLQLEVIVEGVETEAQRDYLAARNKNLQAQGWYFSKPLSAEDIHLFESHNRAEQESVVNHPADID